MSKKPYSLRVDEHLLMKAKRQDISLTKVLNAALESLLEENACPYCKQDMPEKSKLVEKPVVPNVELPEIDPASWSFSR